MMQKDRFVSVVKKLVYGGMQKNIKGNPYSYCEGDEKYNEELGCIGCYQYDPVAYRKTSVLRIIKEVTENIMKKLYSEE